MSVPPSSPLVESPRSRRRRQTAARNREYRRRRREAALCGQPTAEALALGEAIIDFTILDTAAGPPTDPAIGIRVGDLVLPADPTGVRRQRRSLPLDDLIIEAKLYDSNTPLAGPPADLLREEIPLRDETPPPSPPCAAIDDSEWDSSSDERERSTTPFSKGDSDSDASPPSVSHHVGRQLATTAAAQFAVDTAIHVPENSARSVSACSDTAMTGGSNDSSDEFHDALEADLGPSPQEMDEDDALVEEGDLSIAAEAEEDMDAVVNRLQRLLFDFPGCPESDHSTSTTSPAGDVSLKDAFAEASFPSVLGDPSILPQGSAHHGPMPDVVQWERLFCGLPEGIGPRHPRKINLKHDHVNSGTQVRAFDVDSFLGFPSSLAFARKGIEFQMAPQMRQNLATDVHVQVPVQFLGEVSSCMAMPRDIPHFAFGRLANWHGVVVYVMLPGLVRRGEKFTAMTTAQLARWYDQVYLPVLWDFQPADYLQHIPSSQRNAVRNSRAWQVEGRRVETASYAAQQSLSYFLAPENLSAMWSAMHVLVEETPGLFDFHGMQLFFSTKNTKLRFKSSSSAVGAMDHFRSEIDLHMDWAYMEPSLTFVDFGQEICARASYQRRPPDGAEQPCVLGWRRCCLEHAIRWMYDDQPPTAGGAGQQYFAQNMLYDACSMTSKPPKQSVLYRGGLRYSQFYASQKEMVDASKCFPFDNEGLEELSLDAAIRKGAHRAIGGNRRHIAVIERAYVTGKQRVNEVLENSQYKSYGIRQEHRVSWALFLHLRTRLANAGIAVSAISRPPTYVWAIPTTVYLGFLRRSADKFATGFELTRARCHSQFTTWEQTKMLAMFLRCLRYVFGGHLLSRESALWWGERRARVGPPREWYGLGFEHTLRRYGYCWIQPRVDWSRLQFLPEISPRVLFGNRLLRDEYLRRGGEVQAFFDVTTQVETGLRWLCETYADRPWLHRQLLDWLAHCVLRQFRIDVIRAVRADIDPAKYEDAIRGNYPFTLAYMQSIGNTPHSFALVSGNRSRHKDPRDLDDWLWGDRDGQARDNWDNAGYRALWRRVTAQLRETPHFKDFKRRFQQAYSDYHTVLPYPVPNGLSQRNKHKLQRMLYSIVFARGDRTYRNRRWGKALHDNHALPSFPVFTQWTARRWERWADEC